LILTELIGGKEMTGFIAKSASSFRKQNPFICIISSTQVACLERFVASFSFAVGE
jgi:hypothetical protein